STSSPAPRSTPRSVSATTPGRGWDAPDSSNRMTAPQARTLLGTRLVSIDALRGVAALGVVLYHTNAIPGVDRRLWFGDAVDAAMLFGKYGVWLFFVISGFCIHLQWVRSRVDANVQPLGFVDFWKRRIRRLYPPYLATLVFYV